MLRTTIFLTAFLSAAVPASAKPPVLVQHEGYRFEVSSELERNQVVRISGRWLDTQERFVLRVSPNGRVSGTVGPRPVSFGIGQKKRDALVLSVQRAEAAALRETERETYASADTAVPSR